MGDPSPYVSKSSLATALEISESTVDEMVRRGVLPKPDRHKRGNTPLWFWDEVDRRLQDLPAVGTIYVVGFAHYAKIGFTLGPIEYRLAGLQTGCPERLVTYGTLDGTMEDEAALHRRFEALRTYGEWFRNEGELAGWISEGCSL